jgi:menaquinone-specific isochorismate synthase
MMRVFYPNNTPVLEVQSRIVSYRREITGVDLLDFLQSTTEQRVYWENHQTDLAFAGYGIAAELYANGADRFDVIQHELSDLFENAEIETTHPAAPRLFGGFAFQSDFKSNGVWSAFPSAYFVLPRYQLTRKKHQTWLTINAFVSTNREAAQVEAKLDDMAKRLHDTKPLTLIQSNAIGITYPLTHEAWREEITDATSRMKAGELDKVVLSRISDVLFDAPVNPLAALHRLRERYPDTYRFLIEPLPGSAFFGATPELLFSMQDRVIQTAGLAGSVKRGATPQEDDALAAGLFQSLKDRHEHHLVVMALEDLLLPITGKLNVPEAPHILKLSNIQHLYTPITGELNADYHVLEVVEKLHPTPALGGYPRNIAMETIRQSERISRGWYAAPVGWIDAEGNGTFAVAIRSAVSKGNGARLYAGAGIVADSDPDKEWDEIALKFRPMLDALGVTL